MPWRDEAYQRVSHSTHRRLFSESVIRQPLRPQAMLPLHMKGVSSTPPPAPYGLHLVGAFLPPSCTPPPSSPGRGLLAPQLGCLCLCRHTRHDGAAAHEHLVSELNHRHLRRGVEGGGSRSRSMMALLPTITSSPN